MSKPAIKLADHALERRYVADVLYASQDELQAHFAQPLTVSAVDLSNLAHARILGVAQVLSRARSEVSPLTVRAELEQSGATAAIEVLDAIMREYEPCGDSLGIMSDRLRLLAQARRIREHALLAAESAGDLRLDAAQEHAREVLGEQERAQVKLISLHGSAIAAVQSARKSESGAMVRHIPFGFPLLDVALKGGMRPATMAIVGGRTGAGKSSLMLASAILQASAGFRVGIVSCEDPADVWGERAIGHFAHVPTDELIGQQLALGSGGELERVLDRLAHIGVQLSYPLNRPLADVLAAVRALIADGCRVIYVDYVQAIRLGHGAKRHELIGDAAQQLKAECQQHGAVLVLGSQLSRADKRNRFEEPHEADLKESGDLENGTEVVMLLWKSSDAEDARALGKVTKVKWSPRRPRFELQRDDVTGVLRNLLAYEGSSNGNGHKPTRASAWES
jgi:replicative DNA helicase